ncbi:peptidase T [Marinisporobacter balticus]|uniref:Peptidase T n=1 Tax=Marinisporobacter balticus TaxID=2018667 RepID=A0A4R2KP51_9FIRM|nr:peptidase T [Marinisporobacter balticus]TCO74387.1 tripeptide aminopeptidase [Marinisporobacter balticus]
MERAYEKFLRYAVINTKSDEDSETTPSTMTQFDLANVLVEELKVIGIEDAHVDENCYVMGTLKGNVENAAVIGLIAHLDTSPDFSGENVKPKIIKNYDGKDIVLNKELDIMMRVSDFPYLADYKGQTLITTDGTTLLGADDKAGIAEIMTVAEYFIKHPEIKHGDIKICFTPDEEIGNGADKFDVEKFGADFAYTIDGSFIGEIEYENFNAASASIKVHGVNIHPGSAKLKMKNAMLIGMELNALLPIFEIPQYTEGYEGFFHLDEFTGTVELTKMEYIIRDHDMGKFLNKKVLIEKACQFMNDKYGEDTVELVLTDSYFNMKEKIVPVMHIVDSVVKAMETVGVKPIVKAIRGGTDGARLSFMGLPTPNIFTGGFNFHGKFETISIESMDKAVETIIAVIRSYAK